MVLFTTPGTQPGLSSLACGYDNLAAANAQAPPSPEEGDGVRLALFYFLMFYYYLKFTVFKTTGYKFGTQEEIQPKES